MKLESIKTLDRIPVGQKLVKAEFNTVDGTLKSLDLYFEDGTFIRTEQRDYSSFMVSGIAQPKQVKRYKVSGKLLTVDLTQVFAEEGDASRYARELANTRGVENIERSEITMNEDEPVIDGNDLPF